jgi:hypothetical protein
MRKFMRNGVLSNRFVTMTLVIALILTICVGSGFALNNVSSIKRDNEINKIISEKKIQLDQTTGLSEEQKQKLLEHERRIEKEIYDSLTMEVYSKDSMSVRSIPNRVTGYDFTVYSGNEGKAGADSGNSADYDLSINEMYVYSLSLASFKSAWAWTGYRFNLTGSGNHFVRISLADVSSNDYMWSFTDLSTANMDIDVRVFDATDNVYVEDYNVVYNTVSGANQQAYIGASGPVSTYATLSAGHQYVILVKSKATTTVSARVNEIPDSTNRYSKWQEISVDF